jgi:hypothetical protein
MSFVVQVRGLESHARWLTIAEVESAELADAMAQFVKRGIGIEGHPGGVAVGRIQERPTLAADAGVTPAELNQAERDLTDLDEANAKYAAALQAAAEAQLGG